MKPLPNPLKVLGIFLMGISPLMVVVPYDLLLCSLQDCSVAMLHMVATTFLTGLIIFGLGGEIKSKNVRLDVRVIENRKKKTESV